MMDYKSEILTELLERLPHVPVFHYTTQSGLLGIIKTRELWATHTRYLNDSQEYVHALQIAREQLALLASIRNVPAEAITAVEHMAKLVAKDDVARVNVCVASFSESRDSLSQWRAYGGKESAFAIGMQGSYLKRLTSGLGFSFAPCIYSSQKQGIAMQELMIEVAEELIKLRSGSEEEQHRYQLGGRLRRSLHRFAPLLKDPSFHEEQEWRVVSSPLTCLDERFDFRTGNSHLVPYFRVPLITDEIPFQLHEIVIGPTRDPELSRASVKSLLVREGLDNVPVSISEVPYRNW